jgi:ADP-ribose pyrophosphatase YjhB (NUDIX family)
MLYWLLSTKYGIGVQALVFDGEGRLLLLRHTYKGIYPWGLPGGGMQRGETAPQAALRELREEAGLLADVIRLVGVETHPSRLLVEVFYLCRMRGGRFQANAEIADYGYFALAALPSGTDARLQTILAGYAAAGLIPPGAGDRA